MGYLSVDFGSRKIRLLETEGTAKKLKLKSFRIIDTLREGSEMLDDPSSRKVVQDTFKRTLSKGKFSRDPSSMALDSSFCIIRDLSLPFKGDDQIRKVIKFETEGHIQQDIDDVVVAYFKKTETVDKSNLLVMASKKSDLRKHLEFLDELNVDPLHVDLDILCLYNALSGTGMLKDHKCFVVINVARETTDLLVIDRERLVSCRSIPIGAGNIASALRHDMKEENLDPRDSGIRLLGFTDSRPVTVKVFEGEEGEGAATGSDDAGGADEPGPIAVEKAPPPGGEVSEQHLEEMALNRRKDYLQKLRREVVRMLTFIKMENNPEKVYVTGMGCRMPGLKDAAASLFQTDVDELDLLGRVDHSFSREEALAVKHEVGTTLGLAFKQVGHDATRVDFRQEDVKYAKKFDQVKVPLACLTFLLLIMMVLLNLELYKQRDSKQKDMMLNYGYALQELAHATGDKQDAERLVSSEDPNTRDGVVLIRRTLENIDNELADELGRGGTIPELPSSFPVWHAFFDAIQKNDARIGIFKLDSLKIDTQVNPPLMTLNGEVGSGEDMSNILDILREVPMFTEVRAGDTSPTPAGTRKFQNVKVTIDFSKEAL
jgi:Tfp pilus assembly PilM family ATPase